jgi:hypothetical protein
VDSHEEWDSRLVIKIEGTYGFGAGWQLAFFQAGFPTDSVWTLSGLDCIMSCNASMSLVWVKEL